MPTIGRLYAKNRRVGMGLKAHISINSHFPIYFAQCERRQVRFHPAGSGGVDGGGQSPRSGVRHVPHLQQPRHPHGQTRHHPGPGDQGRPRQGQGQYSRGHPGVTQGSLRGHPEVNVEKGAPFVSVYIEEDT